MGRRISHAFRRAAHAAGCGARARHQPHDAGLSGDARAPAAGKVPAGRKAMTCNFASHVDRHFSGSIDPRSEHALREHLPDCESCRPGYERRLLLERMEPRAGGAEQRLARGLGFQPARASWVGFGAVVTAAAAAFLLIAPRHVQTAQQTVNPPAQEFATRGKKLMPQGAIFKLRLGEPARLVTEAIAPKDELAFSYFNPSDAKYLLVFGIDEHKHVYWYYPEWVNPAKKPVAVKIASEDEKPHELPAAITHALDG